MDQQRQSVLGTETHSVQSLGELSHGEHGGTLCETLVDILLEVCRCWQAKGLCPVADLGQTEGRASSKQAKQQTEGRRGEGQGVLGRRTHHQAH